MNRTAFILLMIYLLVLFACSPWIFSDYVFGRTKFSLLMARFGLLLVWPFALLSKPGRQFIFKTGEGL